MSRNNEQNPLTKLYVHVLERLCESTLRREHHTLANGLPVSIRQVAVTTRKQCGSRVPGHVALVGGVVAWDRWRECMGGERCRRRGDCVEDARDAVRCCGRTGLRYELPETAVDTTMDMSVDISGNHLYARVALAVSKKKVVCRDIPGCTADVGRVDIGRSDCRDRGVFPRTGTIMHAAES